MDNHLFEAFSNGSLKLPNATVEFAALPWAKHPAFEGVELKHIIAAKDTGGRFSCHLVRIAPNKGLESHQHETQLEIHEVIAGSGLCVNAGAALIYEPGTISMMPSCAPHKVHAGDEGLYLFAKFIPALC